MERDTVILSLEKYHRLKDAESKMEALKSNHVVRIDYDIDHNITFGCGPSKETYYISENEAINKLSTELKEAMSKSRAVRITNINLEEKIEDLNRTIKRLENIINPKPKLPKELSVEDIKKMGYFEFKKWKKSHGK